MSDTDKQYKNQADFFESNGDCYLRGSFFECENSFTVEEMYLHFKERLLSELGISENYFGQHR